MAAFLAIYTVTVAAPAARGPSNGFVAYYAAAHICAHSPRDFVRAYDNDWFAALIGRLGAPGIRDILKAQPPSVCLLMLPLAALSMSAARVAWTALSLLVFLPASLILLARALGISVNWTFWTLPLILLYRPLIENLRQGQAYILVLLLVSVVFHSLVQGSRERPSRRSVWSGGAALALMATTKTAGAWLWPILALKRRWGILAVATSVAAAITLAMIAITGMASWLTYLKELPSLWSNPDRLVTAYQTLTSLIGHLSVFDPHRNPHPIVNAPGLAKIVTVGLQLATLVLTVRWMHLDDPRPIVRALSAALAISLIVTNAPAGEGYHYTLILPSLVTAFWYAAIAGSSRQSWGLLLIAALLLGAPLPYMFPPFNVGWLAVFAYPRVYGAYLLWLWLGWALKEMPPRLTAASPVLAAPVPALHPYAGRGQ